MKSLTKWIKPKLIKPKSLSNKSYKRQAKEISEMLARQEIMKTNDLRLL